MNPVYMTSSQIPSGPMSSSPSHSAIRLPVVVSRSKRVAQRSDTHGFVADTITFLKNEHRGRFLVLILLTALALGSVIGAWNPPFRYRVNCVTDRAIICNTPFSIFSLEQTQIEVYRARTTAPHVFENDAQPLVQLRDALWNTIAVLIRVNTYNELDENEQLLWHEFLRSPGQESIPEEVDIEAAFVDFAAHFKENDGKNFDELLPKLQRIFLPFEEHGVLTRLPFGPEHGSQDRILMYRKGEPPDSGIEYRVSDVLFRDGAVLRHALHQEMDGTPQGIQLGDQLFNWLFPKKPETLREDLYATARAAEAAADAVGDIVVEYALGQLLVSAGTMLQRSDIALLLAEYRATQSARNKTQQISRFVSVSTVFFLTLAIIITLVFRTERRRPHTPMTFSGLMLGMIITVAAAQWIQLAGITSAEWEILPLLLFVMLISVIYSWQLATILSVFMTIVIVCGSGGNVDAFIILLGTSIAASVQLGRLRTRAKLVFVGFVAGLVAASLTIALGIQGDRILCMPLFIDAGLNFLWAWLAGLLVTGLLPFIEKQFGILTDMSLLELGDVSHPLIKELVKTAPATYGHSTQVGAIAETAADAIRARGLLTRVGAYFHDIGKIMKPEYFAENQCGAANVHDTLEPQVSTIVLIAHVKDGVDLARQYHLPKPLIDLIEQHHGTSLASFFYGRAIKDGQERVVESTYRYPGPKPRTKEAAILMIADASESACRSLGMGIPPNKVEAKIRAIVKQRLDDGQFDESGLTFNELKIVEKSVVNSIVAAMHGRIQYPERLEP